MSATKKQLLHLIAWAQVGVILRVYLGLIFGNACRQVSWVPCVTSSGSRDGGALFTDLPANILGSFFMGLLVSSDVLSNSLKHTLTVEAPVAILPVRSPLQTHLPLQLGLRTGLCGSLTTFASWNLQMVMMLVGGEPVASAYGAQWVEALAGLIVGTLCAMASLVVGQHLALMVYHKLNRGAFIPYGAPVREQLRMDTGKEYPAQGDILHVDPVASNISLRTVSIVQQQSVTLVDIAPLKQQPSSTVLSTTDFAAAADTAAAAVAPSDFGMPSTAQLQHSPTDASATESPASHQQLLTHNVQFNKAQHCQPPDGSRHDQQQEAVAAKDSSIVNIGHDSIPDNITISSEDESTTAFSQPCLLSVQAADALAAAVAVVLTFLSLWRVIHGSLREDLVSQHDAFAAQWIWWSVLFGPVGCYLRFYLARYNGALPGNWKWFPAGTFTANISACVLDYVIKASLARAPLDAVSVAVMTGVISGVGGCLSTVSTWVVEIQKLLLSFPNSHHGYQYVLVSFTASLTLGVLLYGIPIWTM